MALTDTNFKSNVLNITSGRSKWEVQLKSSRQDQLAQAEINSCAGGTCSSECSQLESAAPAMLSEFPSDTGSPYFKRFAQVLLVMAVAKSSSR